MVPDFRRDGVWTPAFAGVTLQETFYEIINIGKRNVLPHGRIDIFAMLELWPGGKDLSGKKHRLGWPSSRMLRPASAGMRRADRATGRSPLQGEDSFIGDSDGWPAWTLMRKLPHGFCPKGPCLRAWHKTEGRLSV